MIDASREFIKDGNKNRLRERDIYKIVRVFNEQIEVPYYSRFVPNSEVHDTIYSDEEFSAYINKVEIAFERWKARVDKKLRSINSSTKPKRLIAEIARAIIEEFEEVTIHYFARTYTST
jgi:type I restriction-modification system DNA methylase subunit